MNNPTRMLFLSGALALTIASACGAAYASEMGAGPANGTPPATQAAQVLTLPELEVRLRDTSAISLFEKLVLKSEIDELMARFRAAHAGFGPGMGTLREPYDVLLTKIRGQVRMDAPLAREISRARESIWSVLTDRAKFASRS